MALSWISVLWSAFSGACLAIGLVHLFVWFKRTSSYAHLAFFFVTVSISVLIIMELLLMHAGDTIEYGRVLRWAHVPVFTFVASAVIFLKIYFNAGRKLLANAAVGFRLISLIVNFLIDPNINYRSITEVRRVEVWNGETVSAAVGVIGQWQFLNVLSSLALIFFIIDLMVTCWRRGDRIERRRALVIGFSFLTVVAVVAINAALMQLNLIVQPSHFFGTFLFVAIAISNELGDDIVRSALSAR